MGSEKDPLTRPQLPGTPGLRRASGLAGKAGPHGDPEKEVPEPLNGKEHVRRASVGTVVVPGTSLQGGPSGRPVGFLLEAPQC